MKYAAVTTVFAITAYLVAGLGVPGARGGIPHVDVVGEVSASVSPWGLVHLLDTTVIITLVVRGRRIIEAISRGLLLTAAFNAVLGAVNLVDVSAGGILLFNTS